jgi:hypothetical protein
MPMSISSLRQGHKYRIRNNREESRFFVMDIRSENDILVKDIYTLEVFNLEVFLKYGIGKDFELDELE